jgi:DNA mismatch repair protein MutS2
VPANGESIAIGSKVVTSFGNIGTVEKMDKEVAEVLVGGMRLRDKISNLRLAEGIHDGKNASRTKHAETRASASVSRPIDSPDAPTELNLIGKTTAEADYELDRFIDEAYMGSVPRVRIIHGFGTGALKNFVHHFLKDHDLVERFEFASPDHGGQGATIAELKL